jgi:hypothetical protein
MSKGKIKGCGHCVVSVLTFINRSIINVDVEKTSSDQDEKFQPRTDCDVEENSALPFSPQHPVLKDPQAATKLKPASSYEGM